MFDQVKVNQNSIINLLKISEKENSDILSRKPGTDFFAMIMEKTDFNNKFDQVQEPKKNNENTEPVKNTQDIKIAENSSITDKKDHDGNMSANDKINFKETNINETKDDVKPELKNKEISKISDGNLKEVKSKKNNKDSEYEISIINQLHSESNIKNLTQIIKAVFNGNKKAEEDNFQKLFSNLKPKQIRENSNTSSLLRKKETDRNQKNTPEALPLLTRELKESISKELLKSIESRKSSGKGLILNDKELKDLASNIIDNIKKNKAKEIVKHEAKIVSAEDIKNDKKQLLSIDQQPLKKIEISEDSSFEKNGGKDKNSGKENFSYNGGKIDFSAKSGLDRMEHSLKMSDFKENLQEIIDKAKVSVRDSRNGTFTVRLNPQELGNVNVNLIMENGVITGKFLVDNEDVKSMLLSSLNDLKLQLEEAGIAVGEFSVNVNDQREKYLKQKDDDFLKSLSVMNSDRDVIAAAADQYNSNTAAHAGHINLVI